MIDILEALRDLRGITATPGRGCTRLAFTEQEDQAHDYIWQRLQSIRGLSRIDDAAGNMFIVPQDAVSQGTAVVLLGSHLDTVIEGGWLDGTLGVVVATHVLASQADVGGAGPHLGLVVFRDEEGVRFNTGLFGSMVFAGRCTEANLDAADADGVRVRDVVPDPAGCWDYEPPVRVAAFLECHIEQGERLTASGNRVGIVTGIVGIRRLELVCTGVANHAGTTDMRRRVDALVPVADVVARLPSLVEGLEDAVITCGRLEVTPGAPNVIPGRVSAIVEIRAGEQDTMDDIEHRLEALVESMRAADARGRATDLQLRPVVSCAPIPTDPQLASHLADILGARGLGHERLFSMAGHDAQHAARRCPAGMFFIPSVDGISHNPAENSPESDILLAGDVMLAWAERCIAEST